jgi:hypothetical protein
MNHLNLNFPEEPEVPLVPLEPDVPLVPDEPLEPELPEEPDVPEFLMNHLNLMFR